MIAIALILAAIYLFGGIAKQVYVTLQLQQEKKLVEEELEKLKLENERLLANKKKFEDPNYIVTYAHGAYMFSKEDEKVFYLPSTSTTTPSVTSDSTPEPSVTPAVETNSSQEAVAEEDEQEVNENTEESETSVNQEEKES